MSFSGQRNRESGLRGRMSGIVFCCLFAGIMGILFLFCTTVFAVEKQTPPSDKAGAQPPESSTRVQDQVVPDYKKYESGSLSTKDEPLAGFKNTLNYTSIVLSVIFVCGLAFLVTRFLFARGTFGPPATQRYLQILDRLALGPQKTLCVVKAGERVLLLGVGDQQITTLAELDAKTVPESVSPTQLPVTSFSSYMTVLEPFSKIFRKKSKRPGSKPFIALREEENDSASQI